MMIIIIQNIFSTLNICRKIFHLPFQECLCIEKDMNINPESKITNVNISTIIYILIYQKLEILHQKC